MGRSRADWSWTEGQWNEDELEEVLRVQQCSKEVDNNQDSRIEAPRKTKQRPRSSRRKLLKDHNVITERDRNNDKRHDSCFDRQ